MKNKMVVNKAYWINSTDDSVYLSEEVSLPIPAFIAANPTFQILTDVVGNLALCEMNLPEPQEQTEMTFVDGETGEKYLRISQMFGGARPPRRPW